MTTLVDRLTRKRSVHGHHPLDDVTLELVNPDGPEAATRIEQLHKEVERLTRALRPFAALAEPKTWPDAPGETGPSRIDLLEGKDGTGELYLGTHFGTTREITLYRHDFDEAHAALTGEPSLPGGLS